MTLIDCALVRLEGSLFRPHFFMKLKVLLFSIPQCTIDTYFLLFYLENIDKTPRTDKKVVSIFKFCENSKSEFYLFVSPGILTNLS